LSSANLDTEGADIQRTTVLGYEAVLYHNKGIWTLVWDDEQYGFAITGMENKGDLFRIAESLKEK
jgi:hypothetical protein